VRKIIFEVEDDLKRKLDILLAQRQETVKFYMTELLRQALDKFNEEDV